MNTPAYLCDGRPVAPAEFYAVACDPRRSVVVEACAGAGKTWMLVSRILRALLDGAEPSQILAITFTRKAAGEMRERLDEWLHNFAAPGCDSATRTEALVQRGLTPAAAQGLADRLGALQAQVLAQGRPVQVQTFHGWFAQLLSGAPRSLLRRLDLAPGVQLLEDPQELRPALMRDFHTAVDADAALRADYLALVRRHRRSTLLDWLGAAWQRGAELQAADAAGTLAPAVPAPLRNPATVWADPRWRADLQALASALGARGKVKSDTAARGLVDALAANDPRSAFDAAWAALMTLDGNPRRQLGDLPAQAELSAQLQAQQQDWLQLDAHDDHRRMVGLARVLLQAYTALKRRLGLADMADLEQVAQLLLTDPEAAGWVQERLDLRVRHLLIDEFQDTSPLQWQTLRPWLAGYAGAGGGASGQQPLRVFIVGDPKQSIYRFRRAEPRVFAAASAFVRDALDGALLACDHTRRNAPEVLSALNAVFGQAALHDGWDGYRPHTSGAAPGGGVWALPDAVDLPVGLGTTPEAPGRIDGWRDSLTQPRQLPEEHRAQQEARAVASAIAGALAAGRWAAGEVMVLARRRSTLARVAEALAASGLPFTVPEALALAEAPEAQDLLALLEVLASTGHDLALAQALKSPLFGVDDSDLLWLAEHARQAGGWWPVLAGTTPLPSAALQRARPLLQAWAEAAARLPPHDLLDRIVHEGDLLPRLAAALPPARRHAGLQAVDALLATALQLDGGRYATPYGFVRALRRAGTRVRLPAPADAIRLLTIHGAKGLEARAVFVVDADPRARPAERATLLVDWPAEDAAPARVAFVARESAPPPSLAALLDEERRARAREELNSLYVAMTRARETLVFSRTPARAPDAGSWWARVVTIAQATQPWPHAAAAGTALDTAPIQLPVLPVWPAFCAAPQRPGDAGAANDHHAPLGRAVHRLLEWLGRPDRALPPDRWAAAADSAARQFGLPPAQGAEVLAIARRILDSPACAAFFDPARLAWAGNEVPLAFEGEVLRLDRLVALHAAPGEAGRTWWVLDYKLAGQPLADPALVTQLQRYRQAVAALQPGEAVRAGFITGAGRLQALPG
ncbi:MAG: UvrD-helicase domain-containing protein [Rubrivivax sp.]|nr:UvrD-helicase domain-containing protein [Rubrivivax sp.]